MDKPREPAGHPSRPIIVLNRRDALRLLALAGLGAAGLPTLASCGDDVAEPGGAGAGGLAASDVRRAAGDAEAVPDAVAAVQALTAGLYRAAASDGTHNLVLSPYSVAVALAMTRNGARGRTADEMDAVLHSPGPDRLNGGLNALTALVESRAGRRERRDRTKGRVGIAVANSLWGQRGLAWEKAFLDVLAREYGAGVHLVDYAEDAEGARDRINAWTADRTEGRIPELVPEGVLDVLTRLVLVNAIHFKAPWEQPFEGDPTTVPFRLPDGGTADVELMSEDLYGGEYASGEGWVAARLPYIGGEVAMAVVVPDDLTAYEERLDGPSLGELLRGFRRLDEPLRVWMPRWEFRTQVRLNDVLRGLGMETAFDEERADFSAMTVEERLFVAHVLHEAMIVVDEEGTEAAAATAVAMGVTSAPPEPRLAVVADRPFLFVIHDVGSATPLFIGRVTDPR